MAEEGTKTEELTDADTIGAERVEEQILKNIASGRSNDESIFRPDRIILMVRDRRLGRRAVRRDAPPNLAASGKPCTAPGRRSRATAGRVLLSGGFVVSLERCPASPCGPRLATGQNIPCQMVLFGRKVL